MTLNLDFLLLVLLVFSQPWWAKGIASQHNIRQRTAEHHISNTQSKLAREWSKSGGVLYLRNFFDADLHKSIVAESKPWIRRAEKELNSLATGRYALKLPSGSLTESSLSSPFLTNRLSQIVGRPLNCASSDIPAEFRVYRHGSFMNWHVDETLYHVPQIEAVYTIENDSNSETQWALPDGKVVSERTEPNSLIMLLAGGPAHQVTPVSKGLRSIAKCVYTTSFERSPEFERLFRSAAKGSSGKAKKRQGYR